MCPINGDITERKELERSVLRVFEVVNTKLPQNAGVLTIYTALCTLCYHGLP